jgi:hypothetical protein
MRLQKALFVLVALLFGAAPLAHGQLTINTSTASDWQISNGSLTLDWDSTTGNVWSMYLAGYSTDLVDTTYSGGDGHPAGLYMDNSSSNAGGTTPTASYHLTSGHYLDWWISFPANSTNPFAVTEHFILQPNDATLYTYFVVSHASTAAAASFGQLQYVYRINLTQFTNTYSVNSGLNNLGATTITLPSTADLGTTDPGRAVQNAVTDLHGFSLPSGFGREFYTKYDYSSYEYLHQAHGAYGTTFGAWTILPSLESLTAGPTKQDLIFTENIIMGELLSGHLDNELTYTPPTGVNTTRIFGPIGFHFNAFNSTITTPAQMYQDALNAIPGALTLFSNEGVLSENGYVVSTGRGTVAPYITGGGSSTANTAWAVLSDSATNFQYSANGYQYWVANNTDGNAELTGVVPGTYRLSAYVLGEWGELRDDNITVTANTTTSLHGLTFTPENFSPSYSPIWIIGTPDRSSHEFLHGKNSSGQDDREFYGNWNYWSDFASTSGAVDYYATAVGSHAATNNLNAWNYNQWGEFDPGLYAGIYNASDDTTDGYKYIIPSYVASLPGASGTNGTTTTVPPWTVHFTTTSAQLSQGGYVDLSVALAAAKSGLTVSLNGHALAWSNSDINDSDPSARSGFSGFYQWIAFEWPASYLNAAGADNVLTFTISGYDGVMYDALRMEISPTGANPSTTGWHDYEYIAASGITHANDAVPNNN